MNVLLIRAKWKLVLVGSMEFLRVQGRRYRRHQKGDRAVPSFLAKAVSEVFDRLADETLADGKHEIRDGAIDLSHEQVHVMSGKNAVRVAVPVKLARLGYGLTRDAIGAPLTASSSGHLLSNPPRLASLRRLHRIPARLITEIILRMMRFGWVSLLLRRRARHSAPQRLAVRSIETSKRCRPSPAACRAGLLLRWSRLHGAHMV